LDLKRIAKQVRSQFVQTLMRSVLECGPFSSATLMCTTIQSLHISLSWQVEMRKLSTLLELVHGAEVRAHSFTLKVLAR
jgi:hypothetical protein